MSKNNHVLNDAQIKAFMQRALDLAQLGAGNVSPNPMVGCVIVHQGKIIGEGWHQCYGHWHAEVNAVADVKDQSLLPESDVFVTLEPCSHFGKTPPCADLLVKHQVRRVYICNDDPNPLVAGKGIQKLRDAGIEVISGVLEKKGRLLNRRFFTFFEKKRPYIILKWAESTDGKIALPNFQAVQISNALSRRWTHQLRSAEDAIMVGTRTAQYDNPSLNTRFWTGKNPIRVLIDKHLQVAEDSAIYAGTTPTICYNSIKSEQKGHISYVQINSENSWLPMILDDLYQRKIQSVIVEGGTALLQSCIDSHLWDEAYRWISPQAIGEGIAAPILIEGLFDRKEIGDNSLWRYSIEQ